MKNLNRKVIVAVAPAARHSAERAERTAQANRSVMTPDEISKDTIACARAGASLVHLHVRDLDGKLTSDISVFRDTIDSILAGADILIEGSTGGVSDLTIEERAAVLALKEMNLTAVNMGSVNLGNAAFVNPPEEIRLLCKQVREFGSVPILECFEPGMIETVATLIGDGLLCSPYVYGVCLGFEGTQPARTSNLQYMASLLPPGAVWYYQHHGMQDFAMLTASIAAGAKIVRVGFEDSFNYAPDCLANSNQELVERVCEVIRRIGYEIATPDEAREIIGIKSHSTTADNATT